METEAETGTPDIPAELLPLVLALGTPGAHMIEGVTKLKELGYAESRDGNYPELTETGRAVLERFLGNMRLAQRLSFAPRVEASLDGLDERTRRGIEALSSAFRREAGGGSLKIDAYSERLVRAIAAGSPTTEELVGDATGEELTAVLKSLASLREQGLVEITWRATERGEESVRMFDGEEVPDDGRFR